MLALVMIVSTMLGAGLQADRERLLETLRNVPLLLKALAANFVLVPLFAWALVRGLHVDSDVSIGILLMAMAPGVPFLVNSAGRKQGGSLAFALEIAFLFSALSVVTIPLTAQLMFPPDVLAGVPAAHFLTTLVLFQLIPLVIGALVAPRLAPAAADRIVNVLHLIFLAAVAVLAVLLISKLIESVGSVYGFGHLLIIAAAGLFSLAAGWLLGGPDRQYRRTLSVATLMRNIGLCALIGTSEFKGTLVVPTILTYFFVTFVLSLPVRVYYKRTRDSAEAASRA
jgi:BASS family bile acid:Na+ symporter